jgi:hypothetical protein
MTYTAVFIPADLKQRVRTVEVGRSDIAAYAGDEPDRVHWDSDAELYCNRSNRHAPRVNERASSYTVHGSADGRLQTIDPATTVHGDVLIVGRDVHWSLTDAPDHVLRYFGLLRIEVQAEPATLAIGFDRSM